MDKRDPADPGGRRDLRASALPALRACALVASVLVAYGTVADLVHGKSRGQPHAGRPAGRAARAAGPPGDIAKKRFAIRIEEVRNSQVDLAPALSTVHTHGARVSVAVYDLTTGNRGVYGYGMFDTASIVKIDILAALLLHAQDQQRELTGSEREYAAIMVERSDNSAATALWHRIGGAYGLDTANERLGLPGIQGDQADYWGLTQTTAAGQLSLLRAVFGDDSPLDGESRRYLRDLMRHVDPSQSWGVSAAADDRSASALKNGWLQRSTTGRWDINSVGRVDHAGHTVLVAALSSGNITQGVGVRLVEDAARNAVRTVVDAAHRVHSAPLP
jgi:hypothetical protein